MNSRKIKKEVEDLRPCPVCDNTCFTGIASQNICSVCKWQDDYVIGYHHSDEISGANKMSLNEARENYKKYGISDLNML